MVYKNVIYILQQIASAWHIAHRASIVFENDVLE